MKKLVICPNCELQGKKEVLGEINGSVFDVLRFHQGTTRIVAKEFIIICGTCGTKVFCRVSPKLNA